MMAFCLENEYGQALFKQFCEKELTLENFDFLITLTDLKKYVELHPTSENSVCVLFSFEISSVVLLNY